MSIHISSTAFSDLGPIPQRYTCEGVDVSPPLSWSAVPHKTQSLVLIVEDPDAPDPHAPTTTWVHWIVYNIPPTCTGIAEGATLSTIGTNVLEGLNDWHKPGYRGPCPPIGMHRYFHKLFALDVRLPDLKHPSKAALERAMRGHILAQAELIGLYQRKRQTEPASPDLGRLGHEA